MAEFSLDTTNTTGPEPEGQGQGQEQDQGQEAEIVLARAWEPEPEDAASDALRKQAADNVTAIIVSNFNSPAVHEAILEPLEEFGRASMAKSAARNRLLNTMIADFSKGGGDAGDIGENLMKLHMQIKDLDPSPLDFLKKGLLGRFTNPIRKYFAKYEKADYAISGIVRSLDKGAHLLSNDNTTLLAEEKALTELSRQLTRDARLGEYMDLELEEQISKAEYEGGDADKIRFAREEILFPLRQRVMDMHQSIVINQQAVMAISVIRRNNQELIRGVDRAKNVTLTALRTGVMVASALFNQRILLEKVQILNDTTESIITSTSRILRQQGSEIQRQATEATVSVDSLRRAFSDALQAIEDVNSYREQALPQMRHTIEEFQELANEGQEIITRLERERDQ
jgi:uncharacterized protein YaaN involved in tellurite resistance